MKGSNRLIRSGSWNNNAENCTVSYRNNNTGFRVALSHFKNSKDTEFLIQAKEHTRSALNFLKDELYDDALMLGRIDILEEKWSEADDTFSRLGNMNPNFVISWIEQAYALFGNDKRGSMDDRSAKILKGLDNLKMKNPLGWYGFALQLITDFPKEAVKALKRVMAIHKQILEYNKIDIDKGYMSLAVFKILNDLYPWQIPYLYAVVLEFEPELRWIVEND